jgi:hypothetical protein
VIGSHPEEAQLGFAVRSDDVHLGSDRLARIANELLAVRRFANSFRRTGNQNLVAVGSGPGDDGTQCADRGLGAGANRAGPSDLGAELRHLDVVRNVDESAPSNIGHEGVHRVAADIDRGQSHPTATLESP